MSETTNHSYNRPDKGAKDWDVPLNENFTQLDKDVIIRGTEANRPSAGTQGRIYLATDTDRLFYDNGTSWEVKLGCPTYKFIKATGQSGDLHLSDATNWAVSKALLKTIRVKTSSTDWDLYVLQNDNGFSTDDANIPKMQIMEQGNGDANIGLDLPYEDEDASNEVHLYFVDNSGTATANIYIIGYEMI